MRGPDRPHLLILGGTSEAARLAQTLSERFGAALVVTTSLAGRTKSPGPLSGVTRQGGFGGAKGLSDWIREHNVDLMVDATHPFAQQISANARDACDAESIPRLILFRKPWRATDRDNWLNVSSFDTAAALLRDIAKRVFLSVGSTHLDAFAGLRSVHLVVRMIDEPKSLLPLADYSVILEKGPFDESAEQELLRRERIDVVVSRNSGGAATFAKIKAARTLNLPVVMVTSPAREVGEYVDSLEGAMRWIAGRMLGRVEVMQ